MSLRKLLISDSYWMSFALQLSNSSTIVLRAASRRSYSFFSVSRENSPKAPPLCGDIATVPIE